ncbi:MAG: undecaprenyl-phosphate glucose phosphotransferase [Acidobacteriota bacterium]
MIRTRHRATAGLYFAGDMLATTVAFVAAWFLRFESPIIPLTKSVPDVHRYFELFPIILLVWPVVFYFHGLYQMKRGRSRVDEALTILVAILLATLLISGLHAWYRPAQSPGSLEYFTYSRAFLGLFALLDLACVVASRVALRAWLRQLRLRGHNVQRILIVGAGTLGLEIAEKIAAHADLGFELLGFLDDDPAKLPRSFFEAPVLGTLDDIERVLAERAVDQVYVALPLEAHQRMLRILDILGRECVDVKLVPDVLQYAALKASLEDLDGTPVINLSQPPLQGWHSLIKRSMDVALAGGALSVLVPVALPIVAFLIWIEDRGPIFYRQERMGLDGRPFHILKFRSMRVNAESSTGPVWAIKDDPRRTLVGGFLRHWSLDEFPQLWNVVRGDMSLVGPRPERPTFVHEFKHKVPQYMMRHRVKAGITGWAQVHGWRGNTSIRKRIEYDLYYIENWSLGLDLKILWMTIRHGLRYNAY